MKRVTTVGVLLLLLLFGCRDLPEETVLNASEYGVLPTNSAEVNSDRLQALIDQVSLTGGTVYLPAGIYTFSATGTQTIGEHCLKMRSNVCILGDGADTVLKPVGATVYGLDMFYFNDYLDTGNPVYLENCRFENFVIDASLTSCDVYTSAGKGFMFNLIRNCHWKNVTVLHTDATGFGVDCPLECSMTDCTAIGCGKAATQEDPGASGFGIGYGFTAGETMTLFRCTARSNRKFGIFFEHQGRFDPVRYEPTHQGSFLVTDCTAADNLYNFGGICAENVSYLRCTSADPGKLEVYFEDCRNCSVEEMLRNIAAST